MFRFELDLAGFNRQLIAFATRANASIRDIVSAHALDLEARVKTRTPVDTGRLRASIHTVLPLHTSNHKYRDRTGRSFDGALGMTAGVLEAIVGTNVTYATAIEGGHSRQAPQGMFAISLREKAQQLEHEIERRLATDWAQ